MATVNYGCISNYNYSDEEVGEENNGEIVTDDTGYVDINTFINQAIIAGEDLDQLRAGEYEYDDEDGEEEVSLDPTRTGWFDPTDAQNMASTIKPRIVKKEPNVDEKVAANKKVSANKNVSSGKEDDSSDVPPKKEDANAEKELGL